jgi:hypothetical protein
MAAKLNSCFGSELAPASMRSPTSVYARCNHTVKRGVDLLEGLQLLKLPHVRGAGVRRSLRRG